MKRTIIRLAAGLAGVTMILGIASPAFADYDKGTEKMSASGSFVWGPRNSGGGGLRNYTFHVTGSYIKCDVSSVTLWLSDYQATPTNSSAGPTAYRVDVPVTQSSFRTSVGYGCLGSFDTMVRFSMGGTVVHPWWAVTMTGGSFAHERDVYAGGNY
jgi:hypothetical protein